MSESSKTTNVVIAGLGGQGVLKASDILADALVRSGCDVKKSEVHGMSQRGGSVHSDVRFGSEVLSPMVPPGEGDFLVVLDGTQIEANLHALRDGGVLITPATILGEEGDMKAIEKAGGLPLTRQNFNVALLGALSTHLALSEEHWLAAIRANLPERAHAANAEVFDFGRAAAQGDRPAL